MEKIILPITLFEFLKEFGNIKVPFKYLYYDPFVHTIYERRSNKYVPLVDVKPGQTIFYKNEDREKIESSFNDNIVELINNLESYARLSAGKFVEIEIEIKSNTLTEIRPIDFDIRNFPAPKRGNTIIIKETLFDEKKLEKNYSIPTSIIEKILQQEKSLTVTKMTIDNIAVYIPMKFLKDNLQNDELYEFAKNNFLARVAILGNGIEIETTTMNFGHEDIDFKLSKEIIERII